MYVDVCFPNNNEEEFIDVAKQLGTSNLIFVYKTKNSINKIDKKNKINIWSATYDKLSPHTLFFDKSLSTNYVKRKNIIYYFEGPFLNKKNFHSPMKDINHVFVKEISNNNRFIGISMSYFINSIKNDDFEKLTLFITLAKKYNVKIFISSFAKRPYDLQSKMSINNFAKVFSLSNKLHYLNKLNLTLLNTN